jgi:hypothetical protein
MTVGTGDLGAGGAVTVAAGLTSAMTGGRAVIVTAGLASAALQIGGCCDGGYIRLWWCDRCHRWRWW